MTIAILENEKVISNEIDIDSESKDALEVLELMKLMLKTEKMKKKIMTPSHYVELMWSFCQANGLHSEPPTVPPLY